MDKLRFDKQFKNMETNNYVKRSDKLNCTNTLVGIIAFVK